MSNVTVHANLIQDALREAIEKIKAGMDLQKAKRVIQERLGVGAIEGIDLQEMQAVVHEDQLAFRCRMTIRSGIAMIIDCNGNCLAAFSEKDGPHISPDQRIKDSKKRLILIADDDADCLDVLVNMLKALGYDAFPVRNGKEAIEAYNSMKIMIDLVILDMKMPFNGEKTYTKLRKIDKHARILLMSGYAADYRIKALLDQGYSGFMTKPFNLNSLKEHIAKIIE